AGERDRLGRALDLGAVYAATVYPLLWWHAHLPRRFNWFLPGDFAALPAALASAALPAYVALLAAYAGRAAWPYPRRRGPPGKDTLVATTAACWYAGIVAQNSDYAFTVTNVLIHGIPYMALVYWYGRRRAAQEDGRGVWRLFRRGPAAMLSLLWAAAFVEELLWDRTIWHERPWLFGGPIDLGAPRALPGPPLSLPPGPPPLPGGFLLPRRDNPRLDL